VSEPVTPSERRVVDFTKTGKPVKHGTNTAYSAYGCRCEACSKAGSERQRKWIVTHRHTRRDTEDKYRRTVRGRASHLLRGAKLRARKLGIPFDLTIDWLVERLKPLECEATGAPLQLMRAKESRVNPFAPSLDQRVPGAGYTQDNVMVVCWAWNAMKQDFTEDQLALWLKVLRHTPKLQ
jgi:hypothetical protein